VFDSLQRRRRRKGPAGDLNVALYIKQQQARGSTRKWRQQWCVQLFCHKVAELRKHSRALLQLLPGTSALAKAAAAVDQLC
jgi:hypothetical protein